MRIQLLTFALVAAAGAKLVPSSYAQEFGNRPCVAIPPGLVSWWDAENGGTDRIGRNHGRLVPDATSVPDGFVGRAFFFGQGDYVDIPANPSLNLTTGITLEAWVNHRAVPEGFVQRYVTLTLERAQIRFDRTFHFGMRIGDTQFSNIYADGLPVPLPGVWYHVVGTFDGQRQNLYVNGERVATALVAGPIYPATSAGLLISTPAESMAGRMDEVRLYDRALSSDEIRGVFDAGRSSLCVIRFRPPALLAPSIYLFSVEQETTGIEYSSDARTWQPLLNYTNTVGFWWIENATAPIRFYRALRK